MNNMTAITTGIYNDMLSCETKINASGVAYYEANNATALVKFR